TSSNAGSGVGAELGIRWEAVSSSTVLLLGKSGGWSSERDQPGGSGGRSSRASVTAGGATGKVSAAGGIWTPGRSGSIADDVSATVAARVASQMRIDPAASDSRNWRINPRNRDGTIDAPPKSARAEGFV